VFVIEAEDGCVVARGDTPTTPAGFRQLRREHELPAETPVALETGTVAFYAARELARVGLRPVVIDAHEVRVKAHRPRQKSDRRDAFELCEGLRRGQYRANVHVPPAPIGALRETLSRRRHFVVVRVAEVNAVKRLLRAAGLGHLSKSLGTDAAWEKLLAALTTEPTLRTYVTQHRALWRCAQEQIVALGETLAAQPPTITKIAARLQTVPGVGPIVALTTVAVFSDAHRFPSAKHAASYAGLVPSTDQSGDRDTHGHITKRGSAALRTMLCEAAHHAQRPTHPPPSVLRPLVRAARVHDGRRRRCPSSLPHPLRAAARRPGVRRGQSRRRGGPVPAHHGAALPAQARGGAPHVSEGACRYATSR
jgi:transposase